MGRDVIARIGRPNLLNGRVPVKFVLEISTNGLIALYSSHDPFTPLITAQDPTPLPIKYLSFASKNSLVQYYFQCTDDIKDDNAFKQPVPLVELPDRFGDDSDPTITVDPVNANAANKYDLKAWKHVQVNENEYQKFIPLKDIVGENYENQVINVPLLIQGGKNAHIALTTTDKPNFELDNIYEFIIGGWENSRVVVQRKRNGEVMEEQEIQNAISKIMPTKFTITITPTGKIFIFSDLSTYKPLIWTTDPNPLAIKYISFASDQSESIDFYYGYSEPAEKKTSLGGIASPPLKGSIAYPAFGGGFTFPSMIPSPSLNDIASSLINGVTNIVIKPFTIDLHPSLENPLLYAHVNLKALAHYSLSLETWKDTYDSLILVKDSWRPKGYMLRFVVYVQSTEGAYILLSTGADGRNGYEIRLGSHGNTLSQIVRKDTGEVLTEIREQNILSDIEPLRVIFEVSNGKIRT